MRSCQATEIAPVPGKRDGFLAEQFGYRKVPTPPWSLLNARAGPSIVDFCEYPVARVTHTQRGQLDVSRRPAAVGVLVFHEIA